MLFIVKIVKKSGERPNFSCATVLLGIKGHSSFNAQGVLDQVRAFGVFSEQRVGLLARRDHGVGFEF